MILQLFFFPPTVWLKEEDLGPDIFPPLSWATQGLAATFLIYK